MRILPATWMLLALASGAWAQTPGHTLDIGDVYVESIDVRFFTLQVHVFDRQEAVVKGLGPGDFEVRIDRQTVPVDAVEWMEPPTGSPWASMDFSDQIEAPVAVDGAGERPVASREELERTTPPRQRLMVLFVQNDFEPSRLRGHLKAFPSVKERLLRRLPREDLLAMVSFDHHFKLRADFTRDRDHIFELYPQAIRRGKPERLEPQDGPSLARHWPWQEAADAASAEHALELLGQVLQKIEGEKSILFLGYGLGSFHQPTNTPHFASARVELLRAQAPLLALNVTDAASNSLSTGLATMAWKTGGTYQATATWPALAVGRVERLFHGHYLLFVPWQHLTAGEHALDVRLRDGLKGRVRVAATAIEATAGREGEPVTRPGTRNRGPG